MLFAGTVQLFTSFACLPRIKNKEKWKIDTRSSRKYPRLSSMEAEKGDSPVSGHVVGDVCNSIRERTIAENSMVVLLQGIQGQVTTVDLRDESTARGRVVNVDAFMNVRLSDVLYRDRNGKLSELQDLFITGRNVRYVHIPDHMDIIKTIQDQLGRIHRVRNFGKEGGGRKEFSKKKK